jgi:hypothetical protein
MQAGAQIETISYHTEYSFSSYGTGRLKLVQYGFCTPEFPFLAVRVHLQLPDYAMARA